jgi:hypothetical protein
MTINRCAITEVEELLPASRTLQQLNERQIFSAVFVRLRSYAISISSQT